MAPVSDSEFEELVRSALDELPSDVLDDLKNVAIVVSDRGVEHHAYGLYSGKTVKRQNIAANQAFVADQISIFRDTLVRDFGREPDRLRAEVRRVVRHEVAHHLGFDEAGVRRLGL